jgi:membrane protease YdiL (CAAX protease family)
MKWLTPLLPYLAVVIGVFWIHHALWALLSFHLAILLSLLLARSSVPVGVLFQSKDIRWVILSLFLCGGSGISLYFLWPYFGVTDNLSRTVESFGLSSSTWPIFIAYFVLVNPLFEEYFWRGYLGSPTKRLYPSDFFYAGFHALVLLGNMPFGTILYSLIALTLAGWLWRQLARANGGLLAPVLGHMAADFTILMAVYLRSFA